MHGSAALAGEMAPPELGPEGGRGIQPPERGRIYCLGREELSICKTVYSVLRVHISARFGEHLRVQSSLLICASRSRKKKPYFRLPS